MNVRQVLIAAMTVTAVAVSAGCAVERKQETVGAYIDDAAITTKVKAKYAENKTVSAMAISVETLKGVVQLTGFAKSAAERDIAESLARSTDGVKSVRNDIVIRAA